MIITDLLNKDIEILEMGGAYPYLSKNDKRKGIKNTKDDPRNNEPEFEDRKFLWCHN